MKSHKRKSIVQELELFLSELREYYGLRQIMRTRKLKDDVLDHIGNLRRTLVKKAGKYRKLIYEITEIDKLPIVVGHKEYLTDIWNVGLLVNPVIRTPTALNHCIDAVGQAIGKLEDDIDKGVRDKQGKLIEKLPKFPMKPTEDAAEVPSYLFDRMQFHPRVIEVSESLFKTGNYASAIFEAFKAVDNFVKERTALSLDGQALMSKVFDENAPIIKLNDLLTRSDRDEQEGFKFMFKGATIGIRNPKAHDNVIQTDPYRTLEYLSLASLLMKRIEEGKVVKL